MLGLEQRQGHWRTGRPLPEAVVALRDFQAPHRKRIEHMRARLHRDQDGRSTRAQRKGLVDDPAVSGIGGTVLRLNDKPLAEVSIGAAVGAEHEFWVYDPRGGGWTVYGKGRVSADGTQIEPDAGVGLQEYSRPDRRPPHRAAPVVDGWERVGRFFDNWRASLKSQRLRPYEEYLGRSKCLPQLHKRPHDLDGNRWVRLHFSRHIG